MSKKGDYWEMREQKAWRDRQEFLKMVDADRWWADEHRVKTRFDGKYRAACSCGWTGARVDAHEMAETECPKASRT